MRPGDHPALGTAHHAGDQLDLDHHFCRVLHHLEHPEAGQAEHRLGNAGSVTHARGLLIVAALDSSNDA